MKKILFFILLITSIEGLYAQQVYVNRIWHFGETEFYIYLNFKDGYDWNNLEDLNKELGDYTFKGEENSRRELPLNTAEKYFDLTKFHELELYGEVKLGDLKFKGVDYFDDMISSSYIAVFENTNFAGKKVNWQTDYFCMTSTTIEKMIESLKVEEVQDPKIKENLGKEFNFTERQLMKLETKTIGSITLSVLSYFDSNYKNYSYLLESQNSKYIPLKYISDRYVMWGIIPTPLMINEKPVLIMEMGVPETDNNWTQLAVYDGESYELLKNSFVVNLD